MQELHLKERNRLFNNEKLGNFALMYLEVIVPNISFLLIHLPTFDTGTVLMLFKWDQQ